MFKPKTTYAKIAFETILFYVSTGQIRKTDENKVSPDLKLNRACVVSVYDTENNLMGCVGDLFPKNKILYDEIVENAVAAASLDSRFKPITSNDLNNIKVIVDVLSIPQKVENFNELKPEKHGLFVKDQSGKSGFVMPGTKGVKTVAQLIDATKEVAGLQDNDDENLEFMYFKSTRYE
ncbi:MAG: AMMECR1 domain-containing protein [Bacteroidota bacterium]